MDAQRTPDELSKFQLQFGAFAPKLREQIIAAGFDLKEPVVRSSLKLTHLQLDADAIARLRIRGWMTLKASVAAERKLAKEVGALIERRQP
jgi:hypothetical protein